MPVDLPEKFRRDTDEASVAAIVDGYRVLERKLNEQAHEIRGLRRELDEGSERFNAARVVVEAVAEQQRQQEQMTPEQQAAYALASLHGQPTNEWKV